MSARRLRAFTLVEFVIGIVFIGVVLGPFLVFVARIHDLNNAVGQQARREAWRSFSDQALAAGINPVSAAALSSAMNSAVPLIESPLVTEDTVEAVAGLPRLVPLRVVLDAGVAEPRLVGGGFQIGAGATVPPRTVPAAPLAPIVMPTPVVTPSDGAVIATSALTAAGPGEPHTLAVEVASTAGTWVQAVFNQPHVAIQGPGTAQQTITAVDLLNRVSGTAWTEYSGNLNAGHRSVVLADGRTRWLVTTPEQRLQIYEPSPLVRFAYQINLGAPALVRGVSEVSSPAVLPFDYADYTAVQSGATALKIDFPSATKRAFGNGWPSDAIGFQWTFHDAAGPFSGAISPFFQPEALSLWSDSIAITALPVVPTGAVAQSATWTFSRVKLPLGVPVLANGADDAGFYSPGQVRFTAPSRPDGGAIGRLSFENGANLSTGPTLSLEVIP